MKQKILLSLSFLLLFAMIPIAQAQSTLDGALIERGFTSEALSYLSEEQKQQFIDYGVKEFGGIEVNNYAYNSEGILVKEPEISARGTIADTTLSLVTIYAELDKDTDGKKRFRLVTNWSWKKLPTLKSTDKIGMAFNSQFTTDPITNGGYFCDSWVRGTINGKDFQELRDHCGGRPAKISEYGASWNFDLSPTFLSHGGVGMNVKAKNVTNGSTTAVAFGGYGHDTDTTLNFELNLVVTGVSISGGGYDEAASQASWKM